MIQVTIIKWMTAIFLILYMPRIFAWFAPFKKQIRYSSQKKGRYALIIPARNEGDAVLPLFNSIKRQEYKNFDTYVVVKESDDPVIGYAQSIGATAFVDRLQKCKGDCLDFAIRAILAKHRGEYDGYVIVDADCTLDEKFFSEMNNAMASGAKIINAKKLVKNYYTGKSESNNIVTACNGLIWTLMDDMGNRFKSDHGYTTMTITTGILISAELIERWNGWIYKKTLTEDMELQRDCGANNVQTLYYSYAKIYMEEAPTLADTNKRRNRWMTGLTDADRIYWHKYVDKNTYYDLKNTYYMYSLWIVYAYIGSLFAIGSVNLLGVLASAFSSITIFASCTRVAIMCFGCIYGAFFVMTFFALLIDGKYIKLPFYKKAILLFVHPVFYMGYIKIVAKAILKRSNATWDEIERVKV